MWLRSETEGGSRPSCLEGNIFKYFKRRPNNITAERSVIGPDCQCDSHGLAFFPKGVLLFFPAGIKIVISFFQYDQHFKAPKH